MTWVWRKVFRFGPFRTTLSTRGLGWSFGVPFLRYGIGPSGTRYISIGIPGTGLYFTKFLGRGLPPIVTTAPAQITQQGPAPARSVPPASATLTANQKIVEAYKAKGNP